MEMFYLIENSSFFLFSNEVGHDGDTSLHFSDDFLWPFLEVLKIN